MIEPLPHNRVAVWLIVLALVGMLAGYTYLALRAPQTIVQELSAQLAIERESIIGQVRMEQEKLAERIAEKVAEAKVVADATVAESKADRKALQKVDAKSKIDHTKLKAAVKEIEKDVKVLEKKPPPFIPIQQPTPKRGWFN